MVHWRRIQKANQHMKDVKSHDILGKQKLEQWGEPQSGSHIH